MDLKLFFCVFLIFKIHNSLKITTPLSLFSQLDIINDKSINNLFYRDGLSGQSFIEWFDTTERHFIFHNQCNLLFLNLLDDFTINVTI